MIFNPKTLQLEGEIEVIEKGTANRIINNVIWGNNSQFNPNLKNNEGSDKRNAGSVRREAGGL